MNSNLSSIIAQFNTGQIKPGVAKPEGDKPKKKPAPKPRPTKAPSPAGGEDGQAKSKLKVKGVVTVAKAGTPPAGAPGTGGPTLDPTTAPLLKRLKDILDFLQKNNGTQFSVAQLQELTGHNLAADLGLLKEVHRHARITYQGAPAVPSSTALPPTTPAAWYSYLPEIQGVRDKVALLNYIRDNKGPAVLADALKRCYLKAADDLLALKTDGKIFILGHPDAEKETVFVRDMLGQQTIQDDVRDLWFTVAKDHVPSDVMELQAAVARAGLRSALANQPVKRMAASGPKERAKRPRQQRINIGRATNAHLPMLFAGEQPKNIDG